MAKKKYWGIFFHAPPEHPHYHVLNHTIKDWTVPQLCSNAMGDNSCIYSTKRSANAAWKRWQKERGGGVWEGCYFLVELDYDE